MLTLPETPGHPYSGVLAGPHLSRPCRFLVPPPFESLSLTLAGSGRVFVTGAGVRNHLILRRRSCVAKLDAGCFPHNSQPRQERKKNQKRKNAATTPPKTYSQLHRSYYKGPGVRVWPPLDSAAFGRSEDRTGSTRARDRSNSSFRA